jgi:hypothetical protein
VFTRAAAINVEFSELSLRPVAEDAWVKVQAFAWQQSCNCMRVPLAFRLARADSCMAAYAGTVISGRLGWGAALLAFVVGDVHTRFFLVPSVFCVPR